MPELVFLLLLALVIAAGLLTHRFWFSFAAQRPVDYVDSLPRMDIRTHLSGPLICEGVIHGPDGRVASRFIADMQGNWQGASGTLHEGFKFASGKSQHRAWQLTMGENGRFSATAEDVIGQATGIQSGSAARMRYRLRLEPEAGGHVLDVTDWLYLLDNGSILNRSEMRKFGIKVAELVATIRPAPPVRARAAKAAR